MNPEKLQSLFEKKQDLENLRLEIEAAYDTYKSPSFVRLSPRKTNNSDPVLNAVIRLENLRKEYAAELEAYLDLREEIEDWLDTVDQLEVSAIIRLHYICGLTWSEVSQRMRNKKSADWVRMRIKRFFGEDV